MCYQALQRTEGQTRPAAQALMQASVSLEFLQASRVYTSNLNIPALSTCLCNALRPNEVELRLCICPHLACEPCGNQHEARQRSTCRAHLQAASSRHTHAATTHTHLPAVCRASENRAKNQGAGGRRPLQTQHVHEALPQRQPQNHAKGQCKGVSLKGKVTSGHKLTPPCPSKQRLLGSIPAPAMKLQRFSWEQDGCRHVETSKLRICTFSALWSKQQGRNQRDCQRNGTDQQRRQDSELPLVLREA